MNAKYQPGIVVIGMETSGRMRRAFQARGFETYSIDLLPSTDGGEEGAYSADGIWLGRHLKGDVFSELENMRATDLWPTLAIFHPDCTYLTGSAEWAYGDGPYHQNIKPGTLVGAERREAREETCRHLPGYCRRCCHSVGRSHCTGDGSLMGRTKQFDTQIRLPITQDMLDKIDAVLGEGEPRLDMIREAIEREIKRRKRTT